MTVQVTTNAAKWPSSAAPHRDGRRRATVRAPGTASGPIIATVMTATIAIPGAVKTPPCAPWPAIELPVLLQPTVGESAINAAQARTVAATGTISGRRASRLALLRPTAR